MTSDHWWPIIALVGIVRSAEYDVFVYYYFKQSKHTWEECPPNSSVCQTTQLPGKKSNISEVYQIGKSILGPQFCSSGLRSIVYFQPRYCWQDSSAIFQEETGAENTICRAFPEYAVIKVSAQKPLGNIWAEVISTCLKTGSACITCNCYYKMDCHTHWSLTCSW